MLEDHPDVETLVRLAWSAGEGKDLSGVRRGIKHSGNVPPYYHFLHGFVLETQPQCILEIGTNRGGSSAVMSLALTREDSRVVTVDIHDIADQISSIENIEQVVGDANSARAIHSIIEAIGNRSLDLLFVDTKHDFITTLISFSVYFALYNPRYIILDDITLNDEMNQFWQLMTRRFGPNAINAVDVVPAVRAHRLDPGFGVIVNQYSSQLDLNRGRDASNP